jgi:hypothetical protein
VRQLVAQFFQRGRQHGSSRGRSAARRSNCSHTSPVLLQETKQAGDQFAFASNIRRETREFLSAPVRPPLGMACARLQPSGVPDGATATAPPVTLRRDHFAGGLQVLRAAVRTARRNRTTLRARRSVSILSQPCHSISSYAFTRKTRRRPAVRPACGSDPGSRCRSIPWYRAARSQEI